MPRRNRHNEKLPSKEKSKRLLYIVGFLIVAVILTTSIFHGIQRTLFFSKKDRVNVVFYGKNTIYYSLGIHTEGDYAIAFPPDLKMQIPGGYGNYRIGALGKLVALEKKPKLFQNTFALATYSFVDNYFYTKSDEVYYGNEVAVALPSAKLIWSSASNASLLDKVYLILYFLNKKQQDFHIVNLYSEKNKVGDEIFSADEFEKRITGYLFQQSYRNEQKSVQILYADTYLNADRVAKVLQGNGIRVGDISQDGSLIRGCIITENTGTQSRTAKALIDVFQCQWKNGTTGFYDILFQLGEREKEWEIK